MSDAPLPNAAADGKPSPQASDSKPVSRPRGSSADAKNRPAPRHQPLVIVAAAAAAGIVGDRYLGVPLWLCGATAVAAWAVWLVLWRFNWQRCAAAAILLSVVALAAGWHHCRWHLVAQSELGCFAPDESEPACLEAVAVEGPRRLPAPPENPMRIVPQGERTRVELLALGIRDGDDWLPAVGRTRLTVDGHLLGVHAGDRLRIFCRLARPQGPQNEGQFDWAAYARCEGRRSDLHSEWPDCVTVVQSAGFWRPSRILESLRTGGDRILRQRLDPPQAALAAALLLGVRDDLGPEGFEAFVETGTVHILSISGLHVGIIAWALLWLMRLFAVRTGRAMLAVAGFTTLYVVLAGAEPPAVRSLILVLVMCAGRLLYRQPSPMNSLAAAALVVLAINPSDLFNTGAQLSFLLVAGLMWFAPFWVGERDEETIDRLIAENQSWAERTWWAMLRGVRNVMLLGVMMTLLGMPLVMARFHLVQPVAPLLNTLLWIPVTVALVAGFALLAVAALVPPLAAPLAWCCNQSLAMLQGMIGWGRRIPGSHFWVPGPADWWLVGFYGGLALLAAFPRLRPPRRWCVGLLAGWCAVGFVVPLFRNRGRELDATALSVGHGCAVVMRLPSGATILYDAGQLGPPEMGARLIAEHLWWRGLTHLDAVVLSHADADHYNALPELLKRFSVGVVYVSPVMFREEGNEAIDLLRRSIDEAGVPLRVISSGDRLQGVGEGCRIEVLHPPRRGVLGNDNANSMVLAVEYAGRRLLLPGDLEPPGLLDVLAEEPRHCDVLMAPHHGSRGSDPPELARWCAPRYVLISGGRRTDPRQATAVYRAAGAQVFNTSQHGSIRVCMSADGFGVTSLVGNR